MALFWVKYYSSIEPTDLPSNVNQSAQIAFILGNPKMFFQALSMGVITTIVKLKQYFAFGWSFKYSELAFLTFLPLLGVVLFMYPVKLRYKINGWFKFAIWGVSIGIIMLTNVIMYLSFTNVGEPSILGVQGRYFFGLLMLSPFIFNLSDSVLLGDNEIQQQYFNQKKFDRLILIISICFLIWMSTMRIGAYY